MHGSHGDALHALDQPIAYLGELALAFAVGRGDLTLETTAGEILAARPELHERTRGPLHTITLRELCTHSAGLPRLPRTAGTAGRLARYALLGLDPYRGQSAEQNQYLTFEEPVTVLIAGKVYRIEPPKAAAK